MLSDQEILALYDREIRIEFPAPGVRWEALPNLVRYVDLVGDQGMVIYSRLDEETVAASIDAQIDYFERIGQDFEWKVYGHDTPRDLRDRLAARGFEIGEPEALLIYDLVDASPALLAPPPRHDIRRLDDPDQLTDLQSVVEEVWQEDMAGLVNRLAHYLRDYPDSISIYAVYDGERAVSVAWLSFESGQFAGLWGGSTRLAYRGHGMYTALLAVRAQEALRRGKRFLTIDASPMSRPIVERSGFRFMTMMYPRLWRVQSPQRPPALP